MKICCFVVNKNELVEIDYKKVTKTAITTMALCSSTPTLAAVDVKTGVQPLINVIVDLAEPISYAGMVKGALQMSLGNEHEGKKAIASAFKGYLVVKVAPMIFDLIDGISF